MTFSYDETGNRTLRGDSTGLATYTYDLRDQVESTTQSTRQRVTYVYDAVGQRSALIKVDGGRFTYVYDAAGRLKSLADLKPDDSVVSSFEYECDNAGNRTSVLEGTGDRVTWSYDATYQLTRERRSGANASTRRSFTMR